MNIRIDILRIAAIALAFIVLFSASVLGVNYLRATAYQQAALATSTRPLSVAAPTGPAMKTIRFMTVALFIDRWVGIEGVVAVSSSKALGWNLWWESWRERLQEGKLSLYDRTFINSPYTAHPENPKFHFISLPGIIAFFYYPGSLVFLFVALAVCAWVAAAIEIAAYRYVGQNWVLCSLLAQVIAYRFIHFGYVPAQSYLLFGSLILNIAILHVADRILRRLLKPPDGTTYRETSGRWKTDACD